MNEQILRASVARVQFGVLSLALLTVAWRTAHGPQVFPIWWQGALAAGWLLVLLLVGVGFRSDRARAAAPWVMWATTALSLLALHPPLLTSPPPIGWWPPVYLLVPVGATALGLAVGPWSSSAGALLLVSLQAAGSVRLVPEHLRDPAPSVLMVIAAAAVSLMVRALTQAAREADQTAEEARQAMAEAAAKAVAVTEGARWDAMVHDDILATLELAARAPAESGSGSSAGMAADGGGDPPLSIRVAAQQTLHFLDHGGVGEVAHGRTLTDSLRQAAEAAGATFQSTVAGGLVVPPEVAEALVSAIQEALRNAVRHARASRIVVRASFGGSDVRVEVIDDGRGFDPAAVEPARLGLRVSVRSQLEAVGGRAEIESRLGRGTTVTLVWEGR